MGETKRGRKLAPRNQSPCSGSSEGRQPQGDCDSHGDAGYEERVQEGVPQRGPHGDAHRPGGPGREQHGPIGKGPGSGGAPHRGEEDGAKEPRLQEGQGERGRRPRPPAPGARPGGRGDRAARVRPAPEERSAGQEGIDGHRDCEEPQGPDREVRGENGSLEAHQFVEGVDPVLHRILGWSSQDERRGEAQEGEQEGEQCPHAGAPEGGPGPDGPEDPVGAGSQDRRRLFHVPGDPAHRICGEEGHEGGVVEHVEENDPRQTAPQDLERGERHSEPPVGSEELLHAQHHDEAREQERHQEERKERAAPRERPPAHEQAGWISPEDREERAHGTLHQGVPESSSGHLGAQGGPQEPGLQARRTSGREKGGDHEDRHGEEDE